MTNTLKGLPPITFFYARSNANHGAEYRVRNIHFRKALMCSVSI